MLARLNARNATCMLCSALMLRTAAAIKGLQLESCCTVCVFALWRIFPSGSSVQETQLRVVQSSHSPKSARGRLTSLIEASNFGYEWLQR